MMESPYLPVAERTEEMADSKKTDADTQTQTAFAGFADAQSSGMNILSAMGMAWFENMSDVNAELLSFVADRVKEDVQTQHQLLHCKSLAEAQHIQAEFVQKAIEQYTTETGKLVELSQQALGNAAQVSKPKN